ncbi:MAG: heme biosynthesis HemY N-terminal domain-containing protein [Caulobacteraceae bacterium]
MIRGAVVLFLTVAIVVAIVVLQGEPGEAHLTWLRHQVDTTAATLVLLITLTALITALLWRVLMWLVDAPQRTAKARFESRRRQGVEALSRGFLAAAAGDGGDARRLAQRAAALVDDMPALVRILAAQAADAAGDPVAARAAYSAMLGFADMRLAGHRGLMQLALEEGDRPEALRHATQAYGLAKSARWAWRALIEAKLEAGDWPAALDLVRGGLDRKIVTPAAAERARAALLAASAAGLEAGGDPKARGQALEFAQQAVKLRPDFAPGAVMAARLLAADGKTQRAAQVLEQAWRSAPHPALWLAYRDLDTSETPVQRAGRLARLANLNSLARESRVLAVEQALIAGDARSAQTAMQALAGEPVTERLAGLFARVSMALANPDEARAWQAKGAAAPQEADWSDLDPEGQAFAYTRADWARLVSAYAERGELIHPRHERRERSLSDLPVLPSAYAESAPFVARASENGPFAPIFDDAGYEEDLEPVPR